ncbi:hypothetical protein [Croceicoccus marinus]|uniref:Uncharacterized protein n=1 Tax=Croceicoccus marinus TaxID=450378 RepID=A0A7G6W1A8_9SPHN|nr:hypothetical protein [Croceicoccus marinus]QNE07773.1 hypothetical protein H4O24_19705 [Croceicoccus marinus]
MNAQAFDLRRTRASAVTTPRILPMDCDLPTRPRVNRLTRQAVRRTGADLCYVLLRVSGWLVVSLLATLGLYVLFFMALGNMSAEGFFAQLANLGDRFVAADLTRRSSFMSLVGTVSAILFFTVCAARLRSLLAIFSLSAPAGKDRP